MHRLSFAIVALAALGLIGCAQNTAKFGQRVDNCKTVTVADVMKAPKEMEGKSIRVTGYVQDLCPGSGCWVEIADKSEATPDSDRLFVWFTYDQAEYGRVPVEAKGHKATVMGKLTVYEESQEERRHFAEEKGASPDELSKIKGSITRAKLEGAYIEIVDIQPGGLQNCEGQPIEKAEKKDAKAEKKAEKAEKKEMKAERKAEKKAEKQEKKTEKKSGKS